MVLAVFFLTPWAALATLAGAASIPLIIHLLNRKRYRVVTWAAMRFLLAAQKRTTRKLRIEQWLLLAVRTLLIILLVLAMVSVLRWMDPVWARLFPGGVATNAARMGRTHYVIAIDASYSMARRHDDGSSFDRATQLARRIVQSGHPGDGFSLVLLGAPAQAVVPGPSDNTVNVAREIDALRLPHGNSDLAGGLAAVEKMVAQPLGKYQQREVYVLTDLQRAFFQAGGLKVLGKPGPGSSGERPAAESDAWQRIQQKASVVVVDVAREGADNLAVTSVALADPLALVNALNTVTAVVHNFGAQDRERVRVDLLIGKARPDPEEGKPAGEPFQLQVRASVLVDVPAGAAVPVTFNPEAVQFTTPGEYVVQVRAEGDVLDVDNARSLVVAVKESIPVLLVNGKPAADRDDQATHHLAVALNPALAAGGPATLSPFRPRVITEAQFADPEQGDLSRHDCVFVCDVARLTERKVKRLEDFLRRGGGVVFTLGGQVDVDAFNRLLYRDGEGLVPARLLRARRAGEEQHYTLTADDDAFQQPPLAAFRDENDRATLLGARFRQYFQVETAPKVPVRRLLSFLPPAGTGRAPLDPAVLEWQRHRGRVVLITTTVNIDWGSWPGSPAFLPFVHELARHAALGAPPRVVAAGEPLLEYLPPRLGGSEGVVATPDGREAAVTVQNQDDVAVVRFPETDQSGVYRLTVGGGPREYLFAVNVPTTTSAALASESDLTRVGRDELEAGGSEGDVQVVTDPGEVRHKARAAPPADGDDPGAQSAAGPAVARYLLLAFLGLLVLEMVLAWRFGSARTVVPEDAERGTTLRSALRAPRSALTYLPLVLVLVLGATLVHEALSGEFLGFLPAGLRDPLERRLGVSEAAPGEGTRWRLEYLPYFTGQPGADRWLGFAALVGLGALAVLIYRYERAALRARVPGDAAAPPRSLAPLAGMRLALLFLTLVVLLPQLRLSFEREGWPDVVLIVDTSKSCGKPDDYQDTDVRDRAEQLALDWSRLAAPKIEATKQRVARLEAAGGDPQELAEQRELLAELQSPSRLNLVKALVAGKDDWLTTLLGRRQVKVHVYTADGKAVRQAEVIDAAGAERAVSKLRDLRPLGESSQLGGAVRAVLNDFRGGSLGAIVMLTDGVTTEGEDLAQAGRHAARADVPLFLVGVGDAHEPRDLLLHDLQAEDAANVRDRHVFDVRVSVKGKIAAGAVKATLWEKKKDGELVPLKEETVALDPGKPVKVRLAATPTEPGEHTYVITVPEQPDETDKSNNRVEKLVRVADARPVKVLYIEGYPRYEFRFVKALLEREAATRQGNRSIHLRVLLADADPDFAVQDKSAVGELPARDELFGFDVVILGDVDPKHPKLGTRNLEMLRDFVRERGGGLLFIAGEQSLPHAYRDTPLADVLPILFSGPGDVADPREREQLELGQAAGYRPRLTPVGQQHPIFRFATDDADNAAVWQGFAPLYFAAGGYRVKPPAEVLAVHPAVLARRGPGEAEGALHPLAVQSFVGAGRVMFFGFDETWRWRYRDHEPRFNQFWQQTVRYLARHRVGRVELRLDRQTPYRRNEPVRVTVRFPDDAPAPPADTPVKVLVDRTRLRRPGERAGEVLDTQTLQLAKVKGSRATYEALLTRTPEGEYKFWLVAPAVEGGKPQAEARVLPPPGELDLLRMNRADLEQAARESRGKFYTLAEADALLGDLPGGTRVTLNQPRPPWPLWNHALTFLLLLGLFTGEWVLRKRRRLL